MELSRQEFQRLAEERLADAEALLSAGRFGGAYYVAGYAVECALKACIARKTRAESWPPKNVDKSHYTHDLEKLLLTAGLKNDQQLETDGNLKTNWLAVSDWSEESRYENNRQEPQTRKLLDAITDTQSGVLTWLRNRW
ncbi:MAG: HEPN domain-containing protein [Bryobacteraceae bacterium]|jgi:HEPN domain-containing protein